MSNMEPSAISKGSLVLVTGVNGFIGSHVALQLLEAGYAVRGTARSDDKVEMTRETFAKYRDHFSTAVVPDIAVPGAFDDALQGCSGVAHVASDLTYRPNPHEVITPMVDALKNILKSAAATPTIKRFVYTSSSTAATLPKPNIKFNIDKSTWNEEAVEVAWKPPPYEEDRQWPVYGASKTQGEKECWRFVREEKPGFIMNTVLPNFTTGEILNPKQAASTGGWTKGLFDGKEESINFMRNFPPQWQVDVKDIGRLHLAALTYPSVRNERLFGFASTFNFNIFLANMRKIDPNKRFPDDLPDPGQDLSIVSNERSVELLKSMGRNGWTSIYDSLKENCVGARAYYTDRSKNINILGRAKVCQRDGLVLDFV